MFLVFTVLWHPRTVSRIFLFWSNSVCEFCVYICAHKTTAGRSRLSCLCRDSVTANCAPSCTPWPWQAAWHFGEACPDTALLKSSGAGTMNWLRSCLKSRGTDTSASFSSGVEHLESIYLPSSPSFTASSTTWAQGWSSSKGDGTHLAWDRGMFPVSLLLSILSLLKSYSDQPCDLCGIKLTVSTWQL